tara:strand:- start:23 stop:511 length:489 start_codon:yes stop_codon:yes gene_type:complete
MSNVNSDDFKNALGSWAAGVTIVTTESEGDVYGLTVSSFSSLSLDPLLILVCIAKGNHMEKLLPISRQFAVSILATGQEEISNNFATSGREPVKELGVPCYTLKTGSPIISGSAAWLDCNVRELVDGGDHIIAIGEVLQAGAEENAAPLLYFRRSYRNIEGL